MSECVVRMEMPGSCFGCPMSFSYNKIIICSLDNDRRKGDFDFRPDWCPIICQLPEGHGDLVDSKEDVSKYITVWDCNCSEFGRQTVMAVEDLHYIPTIVPAEAERSES